MSTCRHSALRAPCSMEREREKKSHPAPINCPHPGSESQRGTQVPAAPLPRRCPGAARRRSASRTPGTRGRAPGSHPAPGSGRGIQQRPRHLGCGYGEPTICCEALPQLPAASPRASLERRLSDRGTGPGAGTTSRPRASPPPINLTLIPFVCVTSVSQGPALRPVLLSACGSVAEL